ncbi:hypothetical protein JW960_24240 [candidate division KSB1 bacterium]|nr:hypothetical protein [candidate division KSB1 bacterium]
MAETYHFWTINRATDLCEGRMDDLFNALRGGFWDRLFGKGKDITCKTGKRINGDPEYQLMTEGKDFDEYFVPIPLKCLGNKVFKLDEVDDNARQILKGIARNYDYFSSEDDPEFVKFWDTSANLKLDTIIAEPFGKVRMTTPAGMGYYEILEQTPNNILIAYSQGGLVARYLAFLDEYVFKKNVISAIITISSPNFGSPLANPANADSITDGLRSILLTLLSLYRKDFHNLYDYTMLNFDALYTAIIEAYKDAHESGHEMEELLKSAIKWFSGLKGNESSAFFDLSIGNFDAEFSVLSLVNAYPLTRIYEGAIISANNNLQDLLYSRFGWLGDLALKSTSLVKLWGNSIWDNITAASDIYRKQIMTEQLGAHETDPIKLKLADEYHVGHKLPEGIPARIDAFAHDVIIPSVYQALPLTDRLLGQYVNLRANHNSGKEKGDAAGKENIKFIKILLNDLKKQI